MGGLFALVFGFIITGATYSFAAPGGTYLVAVGPILFGIYYIAKGLWELATI